MTVDAYDHNGNRVPLPVLLGRGGEGAAYAVGGDDGLAAKVLYKAKRTQGKHDKVQAMVDRPPDGAYAEIRGAPVLTWPRALLYDSPRRRDATTFVGYTMDRIRRSDFVPFYQVTSATRRESLGGAPVTFDRLVRLGIRLCHVVRTLHDFGYAVGDMNDRNVLVSRRFTPLFMDTDSFQVPKPGGGHFPSIVGDQMYWAPELLDVDFAAYQGSRVLGDRYALGVLLFQLFMNGLRPYQARGSKVEGLETLAEKTRAGRYPWAKPKSGVLEPPAGAPDYEALPSAVRRMFEDCFVAGHKRPKKRPSAHDWYDLLFSVNEAGYATCTKTERHVYPRAARECPWCQDPNDPFRIPERRTPSRRARISRQTTLPTAPSSAPTGPRRRTVAPKTHTGRSSPPQVPLPPRSSSQQTVPSAPPESKKEATKAEPRMAWQERWYARAGWVVVLVLALASPAWVLAQVPLGPEKIVVTAAASALFLSALGIWSTWGWVKPSHQAGVAGFWSMGAAGLVGVLVWQEWWFWLEAATGVACLGVGALVFVKLDDGDRGRFRLDAWGLAYGAVALATAYLPVLALGIWILF